MKLKNAELWQDYQNKNTDMYGGGVMRYAQQWAEMMEARIEAGEKLEDIANETSHTADTEGITGFMYGAAVRTLTAVWEHGDALRKWHNGEYGVTEEQAKGGTVNPAILTIGTD